MSIHRWSNLNDRTLIMSLQSDKVAFIKEMDSHVVCGLVLVPRMQSSFEVFINQNSLTADLNVILASFLYVRHMYNTSSETEGSILVLYCFWSINYFGSRTTQDLQFRQTAAAAAAAVSSIIHPLDW